MAAKLGDRVRGTDVHVVLVQAGSGTVPRPTSMVFDGVIMTGCVATVLICGKAAAVVGSVAVNTPPHVPTGGNFQTPPTNQGMVMMGSGTVLIGGRPAARADDKVLTCNDPAPAPNGMIVVPACTVMIGG
ncbi:PAAR domain-containing protein [Amycolatopsis sp. H20-H5]|uniref:PAAR domain-containing protein n=1 Tax=Amycolatopsis sp. H20-H5 TaxID=3046309 RepID=UPI003FA35D4C